MGHARWARVLSLAIAMTLSGPRYGRFALDNELVDLASGYQRLLKLMHVIAHQSDVRTSWSIRLR